MTIMTIRPRSKSLLNMNINEFTLVALHAKTIGTKTHHNGPKRITGSNYVQ